MYNTYLIDSLGCLHCWSGDVIPARSGVNIYTPNADVFIQDNVDSFLRALGFSAQEIDELYAGWRVVSQVEFK